MSEAAFLDSVESRLRERYADVEREPRLPSGREPDFVVRTWLFTLAVEVEYHPEDVTDDVIRGAGQAMDYAGELALDRDGAGVVPVVIYPAGKLDPESREVMGLRSRLPVVPLSP